MKDYSIVSIILPTYNRSEYISKAIDSVLAQTFKNFELIIINDGSTDNTSDILLEFQKKDSRIKIITNSSNLDLVKSLNKGINSATGKYIARIDDDDIWSEPKKLEKQVSFLESHLDYVLVGGGVTRIDSEGKEIMRYLLSEKDEDIRKVILQNNTFAHSNVLFKRSAWEKVGGYNEELKFSEDWDLWMRFGLIGKLYNFQEYFLKYIKDGQNKMNDDTSIIRNNAKNNIRLRWKYRNNYPGFLKAYSFGVAHYLYSFIPFKNLFHPFFSSLRLRLFGQPAYTFYDKK